MNLAILGSTGSIGSQALDIVRRHRDRFRVTALAARSDLQKLNRQAEEFHPDYVGVTDAVPCADYFGEAAVLGGENALVELATLPEVDAVLFATSGFSCLAAVMAAIRAKKRVMLANKETLVGGGCVIMPLAKQCGVPILPVDSEHSAVFQCLQGKCGNQVRRVILTASGGAFRDKTPAEMQSVTAQDALRHPNWSMGKKITVDCATMVNKGLEVIEAKWLFELDYNQIDVVVHRESVVHSMVELTDGSVLAQMSYPTMEIPIQLAMTYPERISSAVRPLNFTKLGSLTFEQLDENKYPCFPIVVEAGRRGGVLPAAVNGGNEVLVEAFLQGKIPFSAFPSVLEKVYAAFLPEPAPSCAEDILEADRRARSVAARLLAT